MKGTARMLVAGVIAAAVAAPALAGAASYRLVGWNNLGMHCMDADFALFSLLPPFNTIHAQLIDPAGNRVADPTGAGITVSYQAVADADGSINTTSAAKTNFWDHVLALFAASPPVDAGLAGSDMPGAANVAQPMPWDPAAGWFIATGVPITPYDDAGHKNPYPMMRLVARDARNAVLATTDIVLPVSDEMDCKTCHGSDAGPAAQPAAGWSADPDPQRAMRINILRLHDDRQQGDATFAAALADAGYDPAGLYATAAGGTSILCANCHLSEALPGSGRPGIAPLTQAMHGLHATVVDPTTQTTLDATENRSACYRCHPGSATRCLRGAMGSAVAADGSMAMQCQSCHGAMHDVASTARTGWLDEPACQSCHTGTAVANAGQIRFLSVFDAPGHRRLPADPTFATNGDTPAPGLSLYRFSTGHGGLACEACHGSTHAEFPSSHRNDNVQSIAIQGHAGMLSECSSCHATVPATVNGGPHGMHPVGQGWVSQHAGLLEQSGGASACRSCHGADYRGTVLSRAQADRTISTEFGTKTFWRGFQIGCYTCHQGPSGGEGGSANHAPVVTSTSAAIGGAPVAIPLVASDADGDPLVLRIVSQPAHGTAGLAGTVATYFPEAGYSGTDTFTFAAWDGSTDSNLGTVTINAGTGACTGPDLDGDGVPDVCDPADATITVSRVTLRETARGAQAKAKGTFVTAVPGDVFDASAGVVVTVTDAAGFRIAGAWSAAECHAKPGGPIKCSRADKTAKAIFKPVPGTPGSWRWTTSLRGANAGGAFNGPVTVDVAHGAAIDRVGQAVACEASATRLVCL